MSTFPDTVADGRKSNFTQTCNLLSQYLKEKRSSGPLSLGMSGKMESRATTMDLLTNLQNTDDALRQNASAMDFLPHFVENRCIKQSNLSRSPAPETPQLTIFYAGKVLVFDAFPPEKATEVMELATKLGSDNSANDKNSPRPGPQAFGSDMRYPRRASLLKFLEKRKERVIARGPYQINNLKHGGSSSVGHPEDQSSKCFDLNL